MPRCPNCRRPVENNDTKCGFCGESLANQNKDVDDRDPNRNGRDQPRGSPQESRPTDRRATPGEESSQQQSSYGQTSSTQNTHKQTRRQRDPPSQPPENNVSSARTERSERSGGSSRRALLLGGVGGISVAALFGGGAWFFLEQDEDRPDDTSENNQQNTINQEDQNQEDQNQEDQNQEDQNQEDQNQEDQKNPGPETPEHRFVVDKSGSGDYSNVSDAVTVAENGDVIKLNEGDYTFKPEINQSGYSGNSFEKKITFVGEDREGTNLHFEPSSYSGNPSVALREWFNVEEKVEVKENLPSFWNLTLTTPSNALIDWGHLTADHAFNYCNIDAKLFLTGANVYDSIFNKKAAFDEGDVSNSEFNSTVSIVTGEYRNSTFQNGINVPAVGQLFGGSTFLEYDITNCEINSNNDNVAFIASDAAINSTIKWCTVKGKAEFPKDHDEEEWVGNRFESKSDIDYYIDGNGPELIYGNAFIDGDLRINDDTQIQNDQELGNYYAAWNEATDDDEDGIADLPRLIPGDAELTDQNPLMTADLTEYDIEI